MIAKFNKLGTHRHEGFLKIRIDLYPEPHDNSFFLAYRKVPIRPYTEGETDEKSQAIVAKVYKLHPIFSHFIIISPFITRRSLKNLLKDAFDEATANHLDSLFSNPEAPSNMKKAGEILEKKSVFAKRMIRFMNVRITETQVNLRLSGLEVKVGTPI